MPNTLWKFLDDTGTFAAKNPHKLRSIYFPLANEGGLLSSITPDLHGDIKIDQHTFLTPPASAEDLKETRYNRNFWVYIKGIGAWSASSGEIDESLVTAGMLWHEVTRVNKTIGLKANFTNFIPVTSHTVEIMVVELANTSRKKLVITPTAAIPIYGRSADRLRDHRHVSSLLNRIKVHEYGLSVKPTMCFEERGHKINMTSYFVFGCDSDGNPPTGLFSTMLEFSGEEGNLDRPHAVLKNIPPVKNTASARQGKEAIGGLRFKTTTLLPGKSRKYIVVMGITQKDSPEKIFTNFNSYKKIESALRLNKDHWIKKAGAIRISTGAEDFDRWVRWVTLQPALRKLFGCSFLPHFDYGRGGRGWRDLWQDSLTLLLTNPCDVRKTIINNFGGVRLDGSNATIIGKKEGEFISDRNNIQRVWMDHGLWPFITLNLYINETGDTDILFEEAPYFESKKRGTILEHVLVQHERPFFKIGPHGNFRLEGGDWNDGLDMAKEKGESVTFTAAYAGNLFTLSDLLKTINFNAETIRNLRRKAEHISEHIRRSEWITTKSGYGFFNGYYDNLGKRVEGGHKKLVRMTLTGQVFPIMSGVAGDKEVKEIYRSAKKYLWDTKLRGFRLNTDFKEIYTDFGRAFGFAYGEKENGSFFSHMNIMFAYALYKRNFVREAFEVLDCIYKMCSNTALSKIYPGLPEYFNSDGRGMYHYLTGSASWFILTMLTQVFGIQGKMGNLLISPKLVKEQFPPSGRISVSAYFAGRNLTVNYFNPYRLDYGEYRLGNITINGRPIAGFPLARQVFLKFTSKSGKNIIDIRLVPQA